MSSNDLPPEVAEVLALVADCDDVGHSDNDIMVATGLSAEDLAAIRALDEYAVRMRELRMSEVKQQITQQRRADSIMTRALTNLDAAVGDDITNAELALRAALAMDRIQRNGTLGKRGNVPNVNAPTGVVTLSLPASMIGVISTISPDRIEHQRELAANHAKNVGMIGASRMREHMEMTKGPMKTIEAEEYLLSITV